MDEPFAPWHVAIGIFVGIVEFAVVCTLGKDVRAAAVYIQELWSTVVAIWKEISFGICVIIFILDDLVEYNNKFETFCPPMHWAYVQGRVIVPALSNVLWYAYLPAELLLSLSQRLEGRRLGDEEGGSRKSQGIQTDTEEEEYEDTHSTPKHHYQLRSSRT